MGPKKDGGNKLEAAEPVLQAVVLADISSDRFKPLTLEKPHCLLPLVNLPLIEYTLEFLAICGVEEVFVFCSHLAEKIREYIRQSRWSKLHAGLKVELIVSQEVLSVGDVLRDIDRRKQLIPEDFILVGGDVVSNLKADRIVDDFKEKRKADKNIIMSMALKEASHDHRTRAHGESSLFVINPETSVCVHHEPMEYHPPKHRFTVDYEEALRTGQVHTVVRNDLIDCQIDVCSKEVPALFTENFDYQDMRKDFVRGILSSDILGKKIATNITKGKTGLEVGVIPNVKGGDATSLGGLIGARGYAARVTSTQMYDSVSKDIMSRWTFPMVPDTNMLDDMSYTHMGGQVYKEKDVILSRTCQLVGKVVIGSKTVIGENSVIKNSTVGRNCKIGPNVIIEGAYLWNGVTVGANCSVARSILADDVELHENVIVTRGCVLSFGVHVGPQVTLPEFTKITTFVEEGKKEPEWDTKKLGAKAKGYVWKEKVDEDEEMDVKNAVFTEMGREMYGRRGSAHGAEYSDEENEDSDSDESLEGDANSEFHREGQATLLRAIRENHSVETAALELVSLRMAYNRTFHDLRQLVVPAVLDEVDFQKKSTLKSVVTRWRALITKMGNKCHEKIDDISIIQQYCIDHDISPSDFQNILFTFYELDVVDEDSILQWHRSEESQADSARTALRDGVARMVDWLVHAESEDDEDEDEEDTTENGTEDEEDEEDDEDDEGEQDEQDGDDDG